METALEGNGSGDGLDDAIAVKKEKGFFIILNDGSDGPVKFGTFLSINANYLLKIKNTKNKYLKILLIGDSCFRKF